MEEIVQNSKLYIAIHYDTGFMRNNQRCPICHGLKRYVLISSTGRRHVDKQPLPMRKRALHFTLCSEMVCQTRALLPVFTRSQSNIKTAFIFMCISTSSTRRPRVCYEVCSCTYETINGDL